MRTRTIASVATVLIAVPVCAFYGCMHLIERQRIHDADLAFRPILFLRCQILSQPIAFHRYCRYVVEFPPDCGLTDANIGKLQSLNRLPRENTLDITIRTPDVTNKSLPQLMSLNTFNSLDVTGTSISDDGIGKLRDAFPDAIIASRRSE